MILRLKWRLCKDSKVQSQTWGRVSIPSCSVPHKSLVKGLLEPKDVQPQVEKVESLRLHKAPAEPQLPTPLLSQYIALQHITCVCSESIIIQIRNLEADTQVRC